MALKVLLVDDSSMMRKAIARAIRKGGIDIESTAEAADGKQGLAELASQSVDLVICDWNMPEMNGLEFIRAARDDNYTVPIMMLTTEGTQDRVDQAMEAGANGYVTKPFTPEKLVESIQSIVGGS